MILGGHFSLFFGLVTMPSLQTKILNSAVVDVKNDATTVQNMIRNYGARGRDLKCALDALQKYEETNRYELVSTTDSKSLEQWLVAYCNVKLDSDLSYTVYNLQQTVYVFFNNIDYSLLFHKYGVPRRTFNNYLGRVAISLGAPNVVQLRALITKNTISRPKLKYAMDSMLKSRMGQPTYLSRDEEALVISASVMKGAHDLPTTRKSVAVKLNRVVEGVSEKDRDKPVKKVQS